MKTEKENSRKWNQRCKTLLMTVFVLCLSLALTGRAGAYSRYTIGNYTYDTQITITEGGTCILAGNDSSMDYYEYYSSDDTIATVTVNGGEVTGCGLGSATIMVLGYDEYGSMSFYAEATVNVVYDDGSGDNWWDDDENDDTEVPDDEEVIPVDMTNVTLDKTSVTVKSIADSSWYYYSSDVELKLMNTPEPVSEWMSSVDFSYKSSNEEMYVSCSLSDDVISVYLSGTGTTTMEFTINGKVFTCKIKIVPVYMTNNGVVLTKGNTKQLKVKNGGSGVTWKSLNPTIASVSSTGLVKAKKGGTAVIVATIGEDKLGCAVNVTTETMKGVVNRAQSIAKGTYSQERRMQKGYYDCSSLVWRAYSPSGLKFGSNYWAPVAADIAKWSMKYGKKISNGLTDGQIQKKKLQVGDLFFQTGADNGRYKGIYHVEMFIGYACAGVGSDGEIYLTTKCPARSDGYGYGALVVRPKK